MRKSYEVVSFKALPDKDGKTNRFEAVVSVFGNVDLMGDRVVKGAFKKNLTELKTIGDPIPVIWSHTWGDPFAHIGWADPKEAEETEQGLKLIGYMDDEPYARQVHKLLKERRVKEFSFAYDVVKEKRAADGANELLELKIIEVGPTLKGANPETELVGVKNALEAVAPPAHQKSIYQPLPGSDEERRAAVSAAVEAWGQDTYPPGDDGRNSAWTMIAATFADRVVVAVEQRGEDTEYFEFNYTINDEGEAELTDGPNPVEVTVTLTAKSEEIKALEDAVTAAEKTVADAREALEAATGKPEKGIEPAEPVEPAEPKAEEGTTEDLMQKIAMIESTPVVAADILAPAKTDE